MADPRGSGGFTLPAPGLCFILAAAALLTSSAGIPLSETARCHVCGPPTAESLFPGQPPPPNCDADEFELTTAASRECPPGYKGCLTIYNGRTELTRTCDLRALQGCQVAEGVLYCYCSGPLCNSRAADELRAELQERLREKRRGGLEGSGAGQDEDSEDDSEDGFEPSSSSTTTSTTSRNWSGGDSSGSDTITTTTTKSATSTTTQGDFYLSSSPEQNAAEDDAPGTSKDASSTTTDSRGDGAAEQGGKGSARRRQSAGVFGVLTAALGVVALHAMRDRTSLF